MKYIKYVLALLAFVFASSSQATIIDLDGMVTAATGSWAALTPPGTPVGGPAAIDDTAVAANLAGPSDIFSIDLNVGGFCFSTGLDSSACPTGGNYTPITSIDSAAIMFAPPGGTMALTSFSPSFGIFIPIDINFDSETFFSDNPIGTFSGDISFAPVPIPAAVWLFGSGLIGLVGVARRKKTA